MLTITRKTTLNVYVLKCSDILDKKPASVMKEIRENTTDDRELLSNGMSKKE